MTSEVNRSLEPRDFTKDPLTLTETRVVLRAIADDLAANGADGYAFRIACLYHAANLLSRHDVASLIERRDGRAEGSTGPLRAGVTTDG